MDNLLTPRAFADLHDISYEATNTFIHGHRSNSFVKVINGKTMLDNRELEFRLMTRKTLRQLAHDIYYLILQEEWNDYDQAKELSRLVGGSLETWASYMNQGLFRLTDDRITIIKEEKWNVERTAVDWQPEEWTAMYVEGSDKDIGDIAVIVSNSILDKWYANLSNSTTEYVIFQKKIFSYGFA